MKTGLGKLQISFKTLISYITFVMMFFILTNCNSDQNKNNQSKSKDSIVVKTDTIDDKSKSVAQYHPVKFKQYSQKTLIQFLDSIGHLDNSKLQTKLRHYSDSIYNSRHNLNIVLNTKDFVKLKQAIKNKYIDIKTAKRFFKFPIDTSFIKNDKLFIEFLSFDKQRRDYNEFAISIGIPDCSWENDLYFFKGNRIISHHHIFHRYGLDIKNYIDVDGRNVVYYKENFGSGTGVWQFNYYFYKYFDTKLKPVLNVIENGNLNAGFSYRNFWLETFVVKTNPLTLKFVYNWDIADAKDNRMQMQNDSTEVIYNWDSESNTYIGNYYDKINPNDFLTYYIENNDVYTINVHYNDFKTIIESKDFKKRKAVLNYLNNIKNDMVLYTHR